MKLNYSKAAQRVANALQAASVLAPAGMEFLLGSEVVNAERTLMVIVYVSVFVLFNLLAAIVAGLEKDDSG